METPKLLLLLLSIILIYVFETTFDRGLKVRLFLFATMRTARRADVSVQLKRVQDEVTMMICLSKSHDNDSIMMRMPCVFNDDRIANFPAPLSG